MDKEFYVYGFFNKAWGEFFYIGKGSGDRINHNDRNDHVMAVLNNYPCERVKLVERLTEAEALETEYHTKLLMRSLGKPLIDYENGFHYRQRQGIEKAKRAGKYKGRKKVKIDNDKFVESYDKYQRREINKTELAKELRISRPTLDKILAEKQMVSNYEELELHGLELYRQGKWEEME